MSDLAISVEGLGKRYRIVRAAQHTDRVHRRSGSWANPLGYLASLLRKPSYQEVLWALQDVSFRVGVGEVIGFIGLNGAGKSTLLKVLSGITEPTEGRAVINGRVGTLLEVGTGFHPELTGRENVYLSGAILGMKRSEIDKRFDEIVAFAEVEKFLEVPVKRYSSGMYVRLAFGVAAHLEPEVLLVDEVLAVGDVAFQRKCLGKMSDVARQGRTVLFVSHNMVAVQNLCDRVIWLEKGRLVQDAPAAEAISKYLATSFASHTERQWPDASTAPGNEKVRLRRVCIRPADGLPTELLTASMALGVEIEYHNLVPEARLHVCLHVLNEQQIVAFVTNSNETDPATRDMPLAVGSYKSTCLVPSHLLNAGAYSITLLIAVNGVKILLRQENALTFEIVEVEQRAGAWYGKDPGILRPRLDWNTVRIES